MTCVNPYAFALVGVLWLCAPTRLGLACVLVCAAASAGCRLFDEKYPPIPNHSGPDRV